MKFALAILLALAVSHVSATARISPALKAAFETQSSVDIMIDMKASTAEVRQRVRAQKFANIDAKATTLYNELRTFTADSQKEVLSIISAYPTSKVQGFYLTNKISVKGANLKLVQALSQRADILEINVEDVITLEENIFTPVNVSATKADQWGVVNIGAPTAWANQITGEGVVVSNIDTGVRYTHEALASGYRSDYGWFDPYEGTAMPNDQNAHGTHTMGTIAGRNGYGVAPGATWIACKGCSTSQCTQAAITACFEWTFCPTLADGSAPDCTKRPQVSSNSWAGGQESTIYNDLIEGFNEVGIIPVFAIGNNGPNCRTAQSPGDQPNLISVGATDIDDVVAQFSSHGPSLRNQRIKPEVSAPGVDIVSSGIDSDTSYMTASGTSMATPHVAGAVALLLQKNSQLDRAGIATALETTALRPQIDNIVCDGGGVDPSNPWPNNSYGNGKVDVSKALETV